MKKPSNLNELAEALGIKPVTLQRDKSRAADGFGCSNLDRVAKLEEMFNIDRRLFLYPAEYGNPWPIVYIKLSGGKDDKVKPKTQGKPGLQKRPAV
ncbi:MAG: hypothetical protein M0P69_06000 [Bacteroidales bacterium]|nr:hypothetical protein [Bacteroidales bacterium]